MTVEAIPAGRLGEKVDVRTFSEGLEEGTGAAVEPAAYKGKEGWRLTVAA